MPLIKLLGDIFNLFFLQPIINLVVLIIYLLQSAHIPGALGWAIIMLTVIIGLITWPFKSSQIRTTKRLNEKMQELKPQIEALKQKYGSDKMGFNQAQAALLKEHGVNPAAGCLPSLLPILLIIPLYQVIFAFFEGAKGLDKINYFLYSASWHLKSLPDLHFFGVNLAAKPSEFGKVGLAVLAIPVITAALTFIQSKMMAPVKVKHFKTDSLTEEKEKEKSEDMTQAMQSQMTYMMPLMVGYISFSFPIGLAIYWNTLTILGIIQQYLIAGWGGLASFIGKPKVESTKVKIERK
ncbi:MAG: YidC/Oxa1 family membrane protein insertase [Patescibacteria group bacterium]|nr:YidC/Oxa1 family membrane protein insertase [Patescibacteria group bacterium]